MKKIYTRTGDNGTTSLFGDERVLKNHPRIDAYGTIDEVNALVGLAQAHLTKQTPGTETLRPLLTRLQKELFILGADLATPQDAKPIVPRIDAGHTDHLERNIDDLNADLPPLKNFILPGGTVAASTLHQARTVCRRAERLTVKAADLVALDAAALIYLNRLSDLFFVLARWTNHQAGVREDVWKPDDTDAPDRNDAEK